MHEHKTQISCVEKTRGICREEIVRDSPGKACLRNDSNKGGEETRHVRVHADVNDAGREIEIIPLQVIRERGNRDIITTVSGLRRLN